MRVALNRARTRTTRKTDMPDETAQEPVREPVHYPQPGIDTGVVGAEPSPDPAAWEAELAERQREAADERAALAAEDEPELSEPTF
jgi:hypothetical protein